MPTTRRSARVVHGETSERTHVGPITPNGHGAREVGFLVSELARLPERAILDERRLAGLLRVTTRTIRRMVQRNELPPPVRLAGRSVWLVGKVLAHIEATADRAARDAGRAAARIRALSP